MENAEILDYDEILRKIGNFGRYQKVFLLVVASSAAFNAMTSFALNFAYGEHAHRCKVNEMDNLYSPPGEIFVNNSNGEEAFNVSECSIEVNGTYQHCDRWLYDKSLFTNTIISKFDLVCEEKFYRAHFLMAHYIGLLVGSISGGFLSDTLGRKPVLGIGVSMLLLSMGLRPFIPVLWLVTLLEFVNGYGSVVSYISPFILSLSWLTTVLAMLGKFFTGVTFFIIYMYTAELFPTVLRATVLGVCSMAGRVGSISSAYIGELGSVLNTQFGIALPLTIMGTVGLIAGLLTLCLPETKNISLPESVKDAIQIKADDITNESIELDALTHHA